MASPTKIIAITQGIMGKECPLINGKIKPNNPAIIHPVNKPNYRNSLMVSFF